MTNLTQFKTICSYIGNDFREHFGDLPFKEGEILISKKLHRLMKDKEILNELKPNEVLLGDVYATLKTLDHLAWAIFYCRDEDNKLWAVGARWRGDGWYLNAHSVGDPNDWLAGSQVFSRRFSDTPILGASDTLSLNPSELTLDIINKKLDTLLNHFGLEKFVK